MDLFTVPCGDGWTELLNLPGCGLLCSNDTNCPAGFTCSSSVCKSVTGRLNCTTDDDCSAVWLQCKTGVCERRSRERMSCNSHSPQCGKMG